VLGPYIVDFVCLDRMLVVEADGGQHSQRDAQDSKRDEWLRSQGFTVLRFWNNDILARTDAVKEVIWRALQAEGASNA
jgi:very-short-patch-repair endonuclease